MGGELSEHVPGLVSIDGKTLRGSRDGLKSPLHLVSAWAGEQRRVLGQVATDVKSNEIAAIPELLDLLVLKGAIVTIDAMDGNVGQNIKAAFVCLSDIGYKKS